VEGEAQIFAKIPGDKGFQDKITRGFLLWVLLHFYQQVFLEAQVIPPFQPLNPLGI